MSVFYLLLILILSALILRLAKRYDFVASLGVPTWGYFAGILLHFVGVSLNAPMFTGLMQGSALLIVPLMLLNADWHFLVKHGKEYLRSFGLGIVSVSVISFLSLLFFRYDEHTSGVSGMLVGVYTGGTPNLIAIGTALQVPEKYFFLLNTADILASGIYLLMLLTFLPWLLRRIWKSEKNFEKQVQAGAEKEKIIWTHYIIAFLASVGTVAISAGAVFFGYGEIADEQVPVLMILISILGLLPSFMFRKQRKIFVAAPQIGDFLIVLFCILLGNKLEISELSLAEIPVFVHCFFVLFGSVLLFYFLNYLFKINYTTAILVDTAAVFSPPFVPVIASRLGVYEEAPLGILVGVLGYSVGNLIGISFHRLMQAGVF